MKRAIADKGATTAALPALYGYPTEAAAQIGIRPAELRALVASGEVKIESIGYRSYVTAAEVLRVKTTREASR